MNLELIRYDHDKESTSGILAIDNKFECYTLEDQVQEQKIKGETRIWGRIYRIGIRKQLTPLTQKYRSRFDWFEYHIEVLNVPEFTGIYLHIGNSDADTMGCILLGDSIDNFGDYEDGLLKSTQAYKRFYQKVYPVLNSGHESFINIHSIWR